MKRVFGGLSIKDGIMEDNIYIINVIYANSYHSIKNGIPKNIWNCI